MSERYIYLKNGDDTVKQQMFRCESEKQKVIEKWKALYGKKFLYLSVTWDPEVKKVRSKKLKAFNPYGHIVFAAKKSTKGFYKSLNGYKD
jgi:hypothetical protein